MMPAMTTAHIADLIGLANAGVPNEICGFLAGRAGVVEAIVPIVNELASPIAFRTEPRSTLAAQRTMRDHNWDLLAVYHSHPIGDAVPSARDLRDNTYGESIPWVIVSPTGEIRAWRMLPYGFFELTIGESAVTQSPTDVWTPNS